MQDVSLPVATDTHAESRLPAPAVTVTEAELAEAWFGPPPPSSRRPSIPATPVSAIGAFLGDPLADFWLR